ncbi:unnamed protein product [Bemisia tabaci]|uniref:Protein DPCD n=1 Tax=Bemisia tabaci TaxID=7038 RepID=A0A9P0AFW5_BEMTA|nr:PREDICTED: protein DPCD [Bemisia tabaci]CAH0391983.1 unnamed protein product [Bemisia tabaci]
MCDSKHQTDWLTLVQNAEKTALLKNGIMKVHYKMPNGQEMVEEYSPETNVLLRRAWRKQGLKEESHWEVELGDAEPQFQKLETIGIVESNSSPYVTKRLTKSNIEWRIRNLPYDENVYRVTANQEDDCIVISTTNKKYYKKLEVPELQRVNLRPCQSNIKFTHKFKTLIITYEKPKEVLELEAAVLKELKSVKTVKDTDLDCKTS